MKISPDATKMAACYPSNFIVWDFDNRPGRFSNQKTVTVSGGRPYGVEFSPDSKLLYVNYSGITQYDATATSSTAIASSAVSITNSLNRFQGQLQLAPDEKIYWSKLNWSNNRLISKIDSPNVSGTRCSFRDTGVVLTSAAVARLGLPTFVQSFFNKTVLKVEDACDGEWVKISVRDTSAVDSVYYTYGDTAAQSNSSWNKLDSHKFSGPGKYEVIAYAYYYDSKNKKVVKDTLKDTVEVLQVPKVLLPNDTTICIRDSIEVQFPNEQWIKPFEFMWQDSSKGRFFTIDSAGTYWVEAKNRCGVGSDTIKIDSLFKRSLYLGPDTVICHGDSILLNAKDTAAKYTWITGDTTPTIWADSTRYYSVTVTNVCGTVNDNILVRALKPPETNAGPDTGYCFGGVLFVGEDQPSYLSAYRWNNGYTTYKTRAGGTGWYTVKETNMCGSDSDSVYVQLHRPLGQLFGSDSILCEGDTVKLDPHTDGGECLWQDMSTDTTYTVKQDGWYWLRVKNYCGTYLDSIYFEKKVEPDIEFVVNDTIICQGDSVTLEVKDSNATFRWNTGATVSRIWAKSSGTYWVEATTECGVDRDTVRVDVDQPPVITLPGDTILCDKNYFSITATGQHLRSMYWNTGNLTATQSIERGMEYWVAGINICGADTARILVDQKYTPYPEIGNDTIICFGDRVELKTHVPEHILNDNVYVIWNEKYETQELYVEREGYYRVEVRNVCGVGRDTAQVEVRTLPKLNLKDTIVCDNTLDYDYREKGYKLLWQDGSEESRYRITVPGEYSVIMEDDLGCVSSERFEVRQCPSEIWIPNAFTPNRDGKNETFRIYKDGIYDYQIQIVDRWNKEVYFSNDINEGWDGNVNNQEGRKCAQGTYVYKVQFREKENKQLQIIVGEVNLLR
jgi:gliding motility-associated-like protein